MIKKISWMLNIDLNGPSVNYLCTSMAWTAELLLFGNKKKSRTWFFKRQHDLIKSKLNENRYHVASKVTGNFYLASLTSCKYLCSVVCFCKHVKVKSSYLNKRVIHSVQLCIHFVCSSTGIQVDLTESKNKKFFTYFLYTMFTKQKKLCNIYYLNIIKLYLQL